MSKADYFKLKKNAISLRLNDVIARAEKATKKIKHTCAKSKFNADKLEDAYIKESEAVIKLFQEVKQELNKNANLMIGTSVAKAYETYNEGYVHVFDAKKALAQNKTSKIYESTYKDVTIKASEAIKESVIESKAEILKVYDNYVNITLRSESQQSSEKK